MTVKKMGITDDMEVYGKSLAFKIASPENL